MFEVKVLGEALIKLKSTVVADYIDKAHYLFTTGLLIFLGIVVGAKQIFGEPISCFGPAEYSESWMKYVNSYCFVTDTYTLKGYGEQMPFEEFSLVPPEQKVGVNYYQWVPYLFAIQAALFFAPHLIWSVFQNTQTDISFKHLVEDCAESRELTAQGREDKLDNIVEELIKTHEFRRVKEHSKGLGNKGLAVYTIAKVLNVCNVLVHLLLYHHFMGANEAIRGTADDANWKKTGYFPLVSFCTFTQGMLVNDHIKTVQCVLMMNMINEKVFVLLYAWFIVLFVFSFLNGFNFVLRNILRRSSTAARYLKVLTSKDVDADSFANSHLGYDGLLLLRFIEENAGFVVASEVACKLYEKLSAAYGLNRISKSALKQGKVAYSVERKPARPNVSFLFPEGVDNQKDLKSSFSTDLNSV